MHDAMSNNRLNGIRRTLIVVLALNLAVALAKLGYGYVSGSIAMRADGFQSMLDGFSNVVGLIAVVVASRPPDEDHTFGHERYESLASLLIAAMMSFSVIQIVRDAISSLRDGSSPAVTAGSFGVMFATMSVNIGVSLWERQRGKMLNSDLLSADARHSASDVWVSLGVIAGLIGVRLGWDQADSLISIGITVVIAWAAWTIVRDATVVLTDATDIDPRLLMRSVLQTNGVITAHKLRARSSGGKLLAQVDITVDPEMKVIDAHEIASRVEQSIKRTAGDDAEVAVHVEPAIGRHTRPDMLFGDVRKPTDDIAR